MHGADLAGATVLVAGAGVTGRSVAGALAAAGAHVTVTDGDPARLAALHDLADSGVRFAPGLEVPPAGTDLVVTSPGWRPTAPLLTAATAAGVEVIGDVELAWRLGRARENPPTWLAVTGTNGKTTTVTMLESMLRAGGVEAVACGNVGFAVLDAVLAGYDTLAVELSSFQLHWSNTLAPEASVVLNVAEDHLDWHGGMDEYAAAKGRIHRNSATVVYDRAESFSAALAARDAAPYARRVSYGSDAPGPGELGVDGGVLLDRAFVDDGGGTGQLGPVADVRPAGPHNVA
ncbi:Mur ligase family protein, partial [Saccharomonospora iraqiensis]|uniref:Mur ligase family protein n=1 Tax=Saccharomonospora iraqiensis TaxID=52698 RepID=UPI00022E006B